MSSQGAPFLILCVLLPIVLTEGLLQLCWRTFGDRGAYPWYSCLLRTLAYSPCLVVGAQGLTPLPLSSALFLTWRGSDGSIVWLNGLPEIFVAIVCLLISFGIRLVTVPARKTVNDKG